MLKFVTAGESHGKGVIAVMEGIPAHLPLSEGDINPELKRRQMGYGRGKRMKIELDRADILSGVRKGETMGSPIAIAVWNKDAHKKSLKLVCVPRPGHADLAGAIKYDQADIRNVWERASARETAARVAAGAVAKKLLKEFKIEVYSHVIQIGSISVDTADIDYKKLKNKIKSIDSSPLRCMHKEAEADMMMQIDQAKREGDTVGGVFEVIAFGVLPGLGSYVQWNERLNMRLSGALMSIPGIKGVEIGLGFESAGLFGSDVHDEIAYKKGFVRKSNNAGGIEGGISNGEPIVLRAAMKPIASLPSPLDSVNLKTKKKAKAAVLRADICAVPAAGVVGEAMVALILAQAMHEKYGGDTVKEMKKNYRGSKSS